MSQDTLKMLSNNESAIFDESERKAIREYITKHNDWKTSDIVREVVPTHFPKHTVSLLTGMVGRKQIHAHADPIVWPPVKAEQGIVITNDNTTAIQDEKPKKTNEKSPVDRFSIPWTKEEDNLLFDNADRISTRYKDLWATLIPNRTIGAICARGNVLKKRGVIPNVPVTMPYAKPTDTVSTVFKQEFSAPQTSPESPALSESPMQLIATLTELATKLSNSNIHCKIFIDFGNGLRLNLDK